MTNFSILVEVLGTLSRTYFLQIYLFYNYCLTCTKPAGDIHKVQCRLINQFDRVTSSHYGTLSIQQIVIRIFLDKTDPYNVCDASVVALIHAIQDQCNVCDAHFKRYHKINILTH